MIHQAPASLQVTLTLAWAAFRVHPDRFAKPAALARAGTLGAERRQTAVENAERPPPLEERLQREWIDRTAIHEALMTGPAAAGAGPLPSFARGVQAVLRLLRRSAVASTL
jgi:hypothetical protein